jgi:hypothetical protein
MSDGTVKPIESGSVAGRDADDYAPSIAFVAVIMISGILLTAGWCGLLIWGASALVRSAAVLVGVLFG